MKRLLMMIGCIATCLLGLSGNAHAQTQSDMNQSAGAELRAAETEMEELLARLLKTAEGKPHSLAKLKQAQSAWQSFRDAHIKAYWPSEEPGWYGSAHPLCVATEMTRLTKARIAELRDMTRWVEGDVCWCQWPE